MLFSIPRRSRSVQVIPSEPDGGVDSFQDRLRHGVDEVLLVANVAVEGHRRYPELPREAPQADRLEAFSGADLEGPGHDGPRGSGRPSSRMHVLFGVPCFIA